MSEKIELTEADKALDLVLKLKETTEAIGYLAANNIQIPPEAIEMQVYMRRGIVAEARIAELEQQLSVEKSLAVMYREPLEEARLRIETLNRNYKTIYHDCCALNEQRVADGNRIAELEAQNAILVQRVERLESFASDIYRGVLGPQSDRIWGSAKQALADDDEAAKD